MGTETANDTTITGLPPGSAGPRPAHDAVAGSPGRRMGRRFLVAGGLAAGLILTGCGVKVGSGDVVTTEYDLGTFDQVKAADAFEVTIEIGDETSVEVDTDDNLVDRLDVSVTEGRLVLETKNGITISGTLRARIVTPDLDLVEAEGASEVRVTGFDVDDIELKANGASELDASGSADRMFIRADGASKIDVDGTAADVSVDADGASQVDLDDLAIERAEIELSGASGLDIDKALEVRGKASGASSVKVGSDANVSVKTSGASSID